MRIEWATVGEIKETPQGINLWNMLTETTRVDGPPGGLVHIPVALILVGVPADYVLSPRVRDPDNAVVLDGPAIKITPRMFSPERFPPGWEGHQPFRADLLVPLTKFGTYIIEFRVGDSDEVTTLAHRILSQTEG